jgi:ABC-2 type transport system permease protein
MTDLLVARAAFRDALRPRRLVTAGLLVVLPSVLALLWRALTPAADWQAGESYDRLVVALVFGFTLTILSVVGGTGVVSQELEQRTIVYLLTRPVPRWRLLLVKYAVSVVTVAAISILSALLLAVCLFGPLHVGSAGVGPDVRALMMGAMAYGSLFLFLGTILPRPLIYGLLFVFGWETVVPTLPGSFARVSIMSYLRVIASREITDAAASGDNGGNLLLNFSRPPEMDISLRMAYVILFAVTLFLLAAAVYVFSTREYVPREDAE